mgnify:CR=1 FL=1
MVLSALLLVVTPAPMPEPKALYLRHCAPCHGLDRTARTPEGLRLPGVDLTNPKRTQTWTVEALQRQILEGKGAMPAHRGRLKPDEAKALAEGLLPAKPKPRSR